MRLVFHPCMCQLSFMIVPQLLLSLYGAAIKFHAPDVSTILEIIMMILIMIESTVSLKFIPVDSFITDRNLLDVAPSYTVLDRTLTCVN